MAPEIGSRVLFDEDGDLVTGRVIEHAAAPGGWAISGDRGGIHYGGSAPTDRWWWTLAEVRDALMGDDDGFDGKWLCDDCGGRFGAGDEPTVGYRYQCVGCGEIAVAISQYGVAP